MAIVPRGTAIGSARLLVETKEGGNVGELDLRNAVEALGSDSRGALWRSEPLFPGDEENNRYFIVSGDASPPLTPQQVFELSYHLAEQPGLRQAEPDLPVDAYWTREEEPVQPGAFAAESPSRDDLQWARQAIRCEEAWALTPPPGVKGSETPVARQVVG